LEFRDISYVYEAITAKQMKTDPYYHQWNYSPLLATKCTFQWCMDCVDTGRRSSDGGGGQTTVRWQKQVFIHTQLSRAFLALAGLSCALILCYRNVRFLKCGSLWAHTLS